MSYIKPELVAKAKEPTPFSVENFQAVRWRVLYEGA